MQKIIQCPANTFGTNYFQLINYLRLLITKDQDRKEEITKENITQRKTTKVKKPNSEYIVLIRPIVTDVTETWSMTEKEEIRRFEIRNRKKRRHSEQNKP